MKPLDDDEFSKLTTILYSAALGHTNWTDFLDHLTQVTGGVKTHLFGHDSQIDLTLDFATSGYDSHFLDSYRDYFGGMNAWAPGFARFSAGVVIDSEQMLSSSELVKTEFYHDWVKPQEDITQGGGALIHNDGSRVFALGGNIRSKDTDKLKDNWLSLVGRLIPHTQLAFEVSRSIAGAKLETHLVATNKLHQLPAIFSFTSTGLLLHTNEKAQDFLREGTAVQAGIGGSITFNVPRLGNNVDGAQLWRAVLAHNGSMSWKVSAPSGQTSTLRCIIVHPETDSANSLYKALWINEPTMMVLITMDQTPEQLPDLLQARFQLTNAEVDVALKLTDGLRIDEISDLRQVSKYTVRNQVKSILSKTGTNTQAELVRLIMGLMRS